jgi:hypothetical protein
MIGSEDKCDMDGNVSSGNLNNLTLTILKFYLYS